MFDNSLSNVCQIFGILNGWHILVMSQMFARYICYFVKHLSVVKRCLCY